MFSPVSLSGWSEEALRKNMGNHSLLVFFPGTTTQIRQDVD
jgi:hypothetical protein